MIARLRRRVTAVLATVFVVIILAGALPLRPALYRALLVREEPRRADAIVVLGGGVHDEDTLAGGTTARLVHGLRLLHRGHAPVVILAGGNPRQPSMPEATVMRRVATELGIRPEVLIVEIDADRTVSQGLAVARIARARGMRSVLLVTSAEHSYRAVRVFRKTGLDVVSTPVAPRRVPSLEVTLAPRAILDRITLLIPIAYEVGALTLYWWHGWL